MDRKTFENGLSSIHKFVSDCEAEAKEIVRRNGGIVHVNPAMDNARYYFIGLGDDAEYMFAEIKDDNLVVCVKTASGETRDIDFTEAVWDPIMLSDFMSALYEIDGQPYEETDNE